MEMCCPQNTHPQGETDGRTSMHLCNRLMTDGHVQLPPRYKRIITLITQYVVFLKTIKTQVYTAEFFIAAFFSFVFASSKSE